MERLANVGGKRLRGCALLGALLTSGCAAPMAISPDDPSYPAPEARAAPLEPIDVAALTHEVEAVRHLKLKEPVRIEALDAGAFRQRLFEGRGDGRAAHGNGGPSMWTALGMGPASGSMGEAFRRVLDEQVVGFYDDDAKALFLRGGSGDGSHIVPSRPDDRFTLAHEIEHALQFQSFPLGSEKTSPGAASDFDAALARRALLEGDATMTQMAVMARRQPGADHWVSRVTKVLRSKNPDDVLRGQGVKASELVAAPPLVRAVTLFPYWSGLGLASDLYRTGGLALLDRALSDPPRSTEQVLHPDRYLAGDLPLTVPRPQPPAGWTLRSAETLGELAMGVVLGQCVTQEAGRAAARGWGGDTFALVTNAQGRAGILWSTVWDDARAAARFEAAVSARRGCARMKDGGAQAGTDVVVLRQDRRVAYVQGLGAELGQAQAAQLVAAPVEMLAARPPFGPLLIPPLIIPEEAFLQRGRLEDGAWVSDALGMRVTAPRGFSASLMKGVEVLMKHGNDATVTFTMAMVAPTAETNAILIREALKTAREKMGAQFYMGAGAMPIGGTRAPAYTWEGERGVSTSLGFVPVCDDKATMMVLLVWFGGDGLDAVSAWLRSVSLPDPSSPMCMYLTRGLD